MHQFLEKKITKHLIIVLSIFTGLLTSCLDEEVCEDVATVPVRMGFYYQQQDMDEPTPQSIDSLTLFALGNDSILYNNQYNVSQVELPLNSTTDSTAFVIKWPAPPEFIVLDTLWIHYKRLPNLISMDCGFVTFYDIEYFYHTENIIDTLEQESSNIRNTLDEHFKMYPDLADDEP